MTEKQFRDLALSLPESIESEHMDHPDFRVRGRIFATLHGQSGRGRLGMVKLTLVSSAPSCATPQSFQPIAGGWGRHGATQVPRPAARPVRTAIACGATRRRSGCSTTTTTCCLEEGAPFLASLARVLGERRRLRDQRCRLRGPQLAGHRPRRPRGRSADAGLSRVRERRGGVVRFPFTLTSTSSSSRQVSLAGPTAATLERLSAGGA
jgi:hypothetical protein